jgi:hypothetical protein
MFECHILLQGNGEENELKLNITILENIIIIERYVLIIQ